MIKSKKKKQKSLPRLKNELQKVFNEYIRKRDYGKPCITCGQTKLLQAGHFYPVKGYDGIRFDEFNVNGECEYDNGFNDAHLIDYAENLKQRIGEIEFEKLKQRARDYKMNGYKFSRSELEGKIAYYRNKIKEIE